MRILHLITRLDRGGSAVNTLLSAMEQAKAGHAVTLAYGPSLESRMSERERKCVQDDLDGFHRHGGVSVCLPALARRIGIGDWNALRQIRDLVARGFDIVHTHTSKAGVLGRLAAEGKAKLVHTPHGHIFHGYFDPLRTRAFILIERKLARRTDALIALTQAERDEHLALGIGRPEQWHVVPSGVDVDGIRRRVASWRKAHGGRRRWDAVSVGRLVPIKGMDRLLRAWEKVCLRRPQSKLAIVGDGPEKERLMRICRQAGLEQNVHFTGWCDPVPYLAEARCFALLSYNEGMGRAVVEAFAAGLPCVVADVCGLAELVDSSVGMRVPADDAGVVAKALLACRDRDVAAATAKKASSYSVARMAERLEEIYGGLVAHAG